MADNNKKKREENPVIEWISDNLRYMELGAVIAVVVIILIFAIRAFTGRNSSNENAAVSTSSAQVTETAVSESAQEEANETVIETASASSSSSEEETTPVESVSAGSEAVVSTVQSYFASLNESGSDTLILTDAEISTYAVSRSDIDGLIVFVTYSYQVSGSDVTIPGLAELYLAENADGTYSVLESVSDEQAEAMQEAQSNTEIQGVINSVQSAYDEVISANPELEN